MKRVSVKSANMIAVATQATTSAALNGQSPSSPDIESCEAEPGPDISMPSCTMPAIWPMSMPGIEFDILADVDWSGANIGPCPEHMTSAKSPCATETGSSMTAPGRSARERRTAKANRNSA